MFEKGPYISFANCGLPYYIGGEVKNLESIVLQTPEKMWERYRVEAKVNHEVISIDRKKKSVQVKSLNDGKIYEETYDALILSPGTSAIKPKIEGVDSKNVFVLKTIPDSEEIRSFITESKAKNVVIVGSGFIGIETAEQLEKVGIQVTVIELLDHVLPPLDLDMARYFESEISSNTKTKFILKDGLKGFETENNHVKRVVTNNGVKVDCDFVILTIGVRPEIQLARDCGLDIGKTNGIVTNEFMQTSDPDIYAVGDSAETKNFITGNLDRFQLAGPANKQGRVAGYNAVVDGDKIKHNGSIGTGIIEFRGVTAAVCGLSEQTCARIGRKYNVNTIHVSSHVKWFPGAQNIAMKVLHDPETKRVIGAQIVGKDGVDKRIDVLATSIYGGMTIHDLEDLDLAYSPQFGAAKDPVVMMGFSSHNIATKEVDVISITEFLNIRDFSNIQVVDVRTPKEYSGGFIKDAINVPVDSMRDMLDKVNKNKQVIVYCHAGFRGYLAARILVQNGFKNVKNIAGGWSSAKPMIQPSFFK